ncbi:MAG: ATP-binding cassette domain-containing protein [Reinekea sp.]
MTLQLDVKNLSYQIRGNTLLKDISLQLNSGELVGIIGPNGAGKSTLLKSLIGIINASYQTLIINGRALKAYSHQARAQQISYLAQHHDNQFPFQAREVIALGGYAQVNPVSIESIDQLAQELDIKALLTRSMTDLSGGEQQLVHFARLLMQNAPINLLDEPTASLDIGHEAHLMLCLKQRCRNGQSALIALHNLNTAATFCDRLILLVNGEILATGTPQQVLQQARLSEVYHYPVLVSHHPLTGTPTVLPKIITPE